MITVLGTKRVVILAALLLINAGFLALTYLYLMPEIQTEERTLRSLRSQASSVRNDIDRMQIEIEKFEEQQERFEAYKKDGFFKKQNRRQVQDILKAIQEKSGVNRASVAVNPANIEENAEAEKAGYKILKSTIQARLESFDDVDVFHYLYLIDRYFPGHVTVESVNFKREGEITGTVLRSIAGGKNVPLVKADIELVWRTMIPESEVIERESR